MISTETVESNPGEDHCVTAETEAECESKEEATTKGSTEERTHALESNRKRHAQYRNDEQVPANDREKDAHWSQTGCSTASLLICALQQVLTGFVSFRDKVHNFLAHATNALAAARGTVAKTFSNGKVRAAAPVQDVDYPVSVNDIDLRVVLSERYIFLLGVPLTEGINAGAFITNLLSQDCHLSHRSVRNLDAEGANMSGSNCAIAT